jgi:hypothetical protein
MNGHVLGKREEGEKTANKDHFKSKVGKQNDLMKHVEHDEISRSSPV